MGTDVMGTDGAGHRKEVLLHMLGREEWQAARSDAGDGKGTVLRPPSLDAQGFVHLSSPELVAIAANRHYPGRTDLVLLVLDPAELGSEVRWEEGDPPEGGLLFPHLHGPLPLDAVIDVREYHPGADGLFGPPAL